MALNRRAPMVWLGNNLSSVSPSFTDVAIANHPAAKSATGIYTDTDTYVTDDASANPNIPFIGAWYDAELTGYLKESKGFYRADYTIAIGVYLRTGEIQRYSKQRAALQQIGEAWETALVNWYKDNLTLGGNILATGDGTANYYSLPLAPLPMWSNSECYGALLVIPATQLA